MSPGGAGEDASVVTDQPLEPPPRFTEAWTAGREALARAESREALLQATQRLASSLMLDDAPRGRDLLQHEREVMREVDAWAEAHGVRDVAQGGACIADVECGVGHCAGTGCLPGSWTCRERAGRDQPHTDDMREACMCNGRSHLGSSTALRGHRLRLSRGPCPDGMGLMR